MFSSRQRMGAVSELAQFLQFAGLATLGSGNMDRYACPAADNCPAGTAVTGDPAIVGVGSHGAPVLSRSVRGLLKSPCFSAAVGTSPERNAPRCSWFHSSEKKKNSLSRLIGPPIVYPQSLRRSTSFLMLLKLLK